MILAAAGLFAAGLLASLNAGPSPATPGEAVPLGIRTTGAGLIALSLWPARYDIARRTIRLHGVTRYLAAALLTGYAWLAVVAGCGPTWGRWPTWRPGGPRRACDAELHAIFLGFVMSMIFAHAPVIVPSVLGCPLPFRSYLYIPLALLHISLILRLTGGDWAGSTIGQWGGALNEVALLLFLTMDAVPVAGSGRAARRARRTQRQAAVPPWNAASGMGDRTLRDRGRGGSPAARTDSSASAPHACFGGSAHARSISAAPSRLAADHP